jgi:aspartate/methionine/tyrosine aminotransferase
MVRLSNDEEARVATIGRATRRMAAVQSPIIPIVGELIRMHPGTISLAQGVVHYPPPPHALDALASCVQSPATHLYGPVRGIPELRNVLRIKLEQENDLAIGSDRRIFVTAGGNMAFMNSVLAILGEGDEVILPVPYYFNHEMAVTMVGARAVTVPTGPGFRLDPESIRRAITPATRAVVTVSPNNPSGAVYSEASLRQVNEICRRAGIYHISDEAYEYFTFHDARHFSPGAIRGSAEHSISLFSFSKSYGFAGWRIGYMVVPEHLEDSIAKIQDTLVICPPIVSQHAAIGALEGGKAYRREKIARIAETREIVRAELEAIHDRVTVCPADGALYFLLRVGTELPSITMVERLVKEHGVAVVPGTTFGLVEECYLRVSFGALERTTVASGVGRLARGLRAILAE